MSRQQTNSTQALVSTLASQANRVRRLRSPAQRTAEWLLISGSYVALVIWLVSPRADLSVQLGSVRFLLEQGSALGAAILSAYCAIALTIPGKGRAVCALAGIPLGTWLLSLGQGCWQSFAEKGVDGLQLAPDWVCLPGIALVGSVPALAIVVLVRQGAPMLPRITLALAILAAAAFGNFGLRFFHAQDASLMVLVWQFGTVALFTMIGGLLGRHILNWRHMKRTTVQRRK